ncbi:MAG TPA: hypothetical protein VFN89_03295 [Solirubrobacterales bacterium]|nr:hypothetical protein [Solirubrobacterales bacterium]
MALVVAVGCGVGSGDPTIATSSLSKAQFVAKVNAICAQSGLTKAVGAYQQRHIDEFSVKTVPGAARTVIRPILQAQIDEMRKLGAPQGDAGEIELLASSLMRNVNEIIVKKPETFGLAERMLRPAAAIAHRYGLNRCEYRLVDEG